jgi:hypothetical protein
LSALSVCAVVFGGSTQANVWVSRDLLWGVAMARKDRVVNPLINHACSSIASSSTVSSIIYLGNRRLLVSFCGFLVSYYGGATRYVYLLIS